MGSFVTSFFEIIIVIFVSGSIEEAWFETFETEETDCDEDFHSVVEGNCDSL